jgi:hypothetical protein
MASEMSQGREEITAEGAEAYGLSHLWTLLRCLECGSPLNLSHVAEPGYPELGPDALLSCRRCSARYPVVAGTARMLPKVMLDRLALDYPRSESIRIAAGRPGLRERPFSSCTLRFPAIGG